MVAAGAGTVALVAAGAGTVALVAAGAGTAVAAVTRAGVLCTPCLAGRLLRARDGRQFGRTWRDIHRGRFDSGHSRQLLNLSTLIRQDDRNDSALFAGACRTAGTVEVVLVVCRRVHVHDEIDPVDVDSACGHIGSHQNRGSAILESIEHAGALVLGLAAVERLSGDAECAKTVGDAVAAELGAREHDRATLACPDLGQHDVLLAPVDHEHVVVHGPDTGLAVLRRVFDMVGQELANDGLYFAIESGGEQHSLSICRSVGEYGADLGEESHVGHLVGFVQRCDLDGIEHASTLPQMVGEATRSCDQNVDAATQLLDLLVEWGAADCGAHRQALGTGVRCHRLDNLEGQFTGRDEHECARPLRGWAVGMQCETGKDGQTEGQRLARAGLRAAEHVLAGDRVR